MPRCGIKPGAGAGYCASPVHEKNRSPQSAQDELYAAFPGGSGAMWRRGKFQGKRKGLGLQTLSVALCVELCAFFPREAKWRRGNFQSKRKRLGFCRDSLWRSILSEICHSAFSNKPW